MKKLRIIVGGFLGIMPAGGITWDYVQYPVGFSLLGHDTYYIEDTRLYPIYQKPGSNWSDSSSCIKHLGKVMEYFGMKDRWAYRDEVSGKCYGLTEEKIKGICKTADVFVNISCSTFMRDEYMQIPVRILIDSDPMFTQIQYSSEQTFTPGNSGIRQLISAHNYRFTFGENIGAADCQIPDCGFTWHCTRQPICLKYWEADAVTYPTTSFTTLMNWTAGKKLLYNDQEWGQKDIEFKKVIQLPQLLTDTKFSVIVNQTGGTEQTFSKADLENAGWQVLDAESNAGSWVQYRNFINCSSAEFSVAKETYVKANTGWFSCRSGCYLAAGKPVITQDTCWSKYIPSGNGLFAFHDLESAREAVSKIICQYEQHAKQARVIAEEYFDSNKVLNRLLTRIS